MPTILPQTTTSFANLETIPDPATDWRLLPSALADRDNSRRMRHYKTALAQAMNVCLTPEQQNQIRLHYGMGLRKSQIADLEQTSCSAICKSMKRSLAALEKYIDTYMHIYDALEQEFLTDDQ